jgi:hypothetical protein
MTDDPSDGDGGAQPQNSYDRAADYARVAYNPRNRVAASVQYELPFGPGKPILSNVSGIAKWLVAGWTASTVLIAQTGQRFSPIFSGFDTSNTNTPGNQRPDRIADGNFESAQRSIQKWFDASAFVVPGDTNGDGRPDVPVGRFGNSGANPLEGPGFLNLDAGLYKTFQISERFRAQLEGTFTNSLNHPNYGLPNNNIRSASVGQITSLYTAYAGGARSGQVGLRIEF